MPVQTRSMTRRALRLAQEQQIDSQQLRRLKKMVQEGVPWAYNQLRRLQIAMRLTTRDPESYTATETESSEQNNMELQAQGISSRKHFYQMHKFPMRSKNTIGYKPFSYYEQRVGLSGSDSGIQQAETILAYGTRLQFTGASSSTPNLNQATIQYFNVDPSQTTTGGGLYAPTQCRPISIIIL